MGRKRRLKPRDTKVYHHVVTRTAQQKYWLSDTEVKDTLIDLVLFHSKVFYVDVLAFAVMDNHYHLCLAVRRPEFDLEDIKRRYMLAQTRIAYPTPFDEEQAEALYDRYTDLSRFMWHINRGTAIFHNKLRESKGTMWGERFWNTVVEEGQCLLNTLAYIEMNPVRANMVSDPGEYPYCSAGHLKAALNRGEQPEAPPIEMLSTLPEGNRAGTYLQLMRFFAKSESDPDLGITGIPMSTTERGRHIDLDTVFEALESREPAPEIGLVYGSADFVKGTYQSVGWLIPVALSKATRDGPSRHVA